MKKEKWLLFQKYRYQHKVTKNIKKQRKRAQAKEQNTSIETDSTKKKKRKRYMNYLTNNLSNSHKDIQ